MDVNNPFIAMDPNYYPEWLPHLPLRAHRAFFIPDLAPCQKKLKVHTPSQKHLSIVRQINQTPNSTRQKLQAMAEHESPMAHLAAWCKLHNYLITGTAVGLVSSTELSKHIIEEAKELKEGLVELDQHIIAYASAPEHLKGTVKAVFKEDYVALNKKFGELLHTVNQLSLIHI